MRKNFVILLTGIIVGSFMTTPVFAGTDLFQLAVSQVKLIFNGTDKTPANGMYWNGDVSVPVAFEYQGTTYLPVRYISDSLGIPIDWDGSTRSIFVGKKSDESSSSRLAIGQSTQLDPTVPVTFTPVLSEMYDADNTNLIKVTAAVRNDDTKKYHFDLNQSQFVAGDGTQYTGSLYLPKNGGDYEIPAKTTQIVQYYASLPKNVNGNDLTMILSKADFSTYPAQFKQWAAVPMQIAEAKDPGYLSGQLPVTLDVSPYKVQVNQAVLWNANYPGQTQDYKLNVAVNKGTDLNVFPNSVELIFELLDSDGKTMSESRYALGESNDANIPVLDDGDQYITFKNVVWSHFNYGTGMKLRVYEAFESGKKLLGTF